MRKVTLAMTALLLVIAMPMLAQAQMIFDFNGQSFINDITGQVSMVSEMFDPAPAPMPLPLDFGAYDYTLVIMDLELESVAGFTEHYING